MKKGGPTTNCLSLVPDDKSLAWSPGVMLDDDNGEDTGSCDARSMDTGAIADLAAKGSCGCHGGTIGTVGTINEALGSTPPERGGCARAPRGGMTITP